MSYLSTSFVVLTVVLAIVYYAIPSKWKIRGGGTSHR